LEGSEAICHAKEYYQKFKETTICMEGYFSLITRLNTDIVKALVYVWLSEVLHTSELSNQFKDQVK